MRKALHNITLKLQRIRVHRVYRTKSHYAARGIMLCTLLYKEEEGQVHFCEFKEETMMGRLEASQRGRKDRIQEECDGEQTEQKTKKGLVEILSTKVVRQKQTIKFRKKKRRGVKDQLKEEISEHKQNKPW